jgi:hypothetical protein
MLGEPLASFRRRWKVRQGEPVVCDMIAFGRMLFDDFGDVLNSNSMDGPRLIHDRARALAAMGGT